MSQISLEAIRSLREQTSAGVMDCKKALEEAAGDVDKAIALLQERGLRLASKKSDRSTQEGVVESYIHMGGRVGAMVEVNCETDFVARTPEFRELAHDLAMQVAAMTPKFVDVADIPLGDEVNPEEACLLAQPFIKDPSRNIQDMINEVVAKLGENIRVKRFERFGLGE